MTAGDVACPAGAYSAPQVVFAGVDDQRTCSACGCEGPQSVTCTGTSTVYTQPSCDGTSYVVAHDNLCASFPMDVRGVIFSVVASGGSCQETGGAATGSATATSPTTICCVP